nr:hypothetical protein [Tanacetum cinerariifolium]
MYLRRAKLMTPKLDNDRNLRQGARGDVHPKTSKLFRHVFIRVRSSKSSESYSPERGVHTGRYVVPTGRVIVLAGRYIVPTGSVIVATGRSDHNSDNASIHSEAPNNHQQPNIQPQIITTVSNNNAKFPYLKKDEYEVALTLKTKGGIEFLSFDDLYYKLKTLEVDIRGYNTFSPSQSAGPSHTAFVSATGTSKMMPYEDSPNSSSPTTYSVPSISKPGSHKSSNIDKLDLEEMDLKWKMAMLSVRVQKFEQKAGRKIDFDKKEFARFNKQKVKCYKCQQKGHFARKCRSKGGNDKQRYSSFKNKEIGRKEEDSKDLVSVDTLVDWSNHDNAIRAGANMLYNMINGANLKEANTPSDAGEFALMGVTSEVHNRPFGCDNKYNELTKLYDAHNKQNNEYFIQDQAYKNSLKMLEKQKRVLQQNQLTLEDKIRVLSIELENTSNLLKYSEKINADCETAKKDLQTQLDNHFVQTKKWKTSSKNLYKLIDSSMSVRTKVGLGFTDYISQNELGWDDSAFSVFTTTSEDVKGRPTFYRASCNKNGSFNKKASHFRKHASSISKFCFVCGSDTHMIKDCDFYEQQMANTTVSIGVVPAASPQPVPTGKPKVKPVPTGIDGQLLVSPQQVVLGRHIEKETPFSATEDEGIFDSGCSRSMTGNKDRLDDFQVIHGGKVTFGGGEGRITGKGTIRTPTLDFENVYYVKELQQFNLFSISQICDKKNQVLFTDIECLVLSTDFKLPDDSMVVLKVPTKHNLYTINLNDLCPRGNLACLVAYASFDECVKWHRRMAHVKYRNMNRLVKGNLVRGLPPKLFKNGHTYVACYKGQQHKASYKAINAMSSIFEPLQLLHMDLFRPTSIRSIDHKFYCLVITDDYSRFCWVFFLEHKDETYPTLKSFINLVENQLNKKRDYSNPRTSQQNRVTKRKNRTLIEAARTMLADFKLPTMFRTKAVRTACYVLNRVSVSSPHNKTPYALLTGNIPTVSHFKLFGCHVTILNTNDHLGKFDEKTDEGYIVGYSTSNKAYRGLGHEWYFDLNYLTDSLGYKHVSANHPAGTQGNKTNSAGTQDADSDSDYDEQVIIVPSYPSHSIQGTHPIDTLGDKVDDSPFPSADEIFQKELAKLKDQEQRVTSDAKELRTPAGVKAVLLGCIPVPTGRVPVPAGSVPVPTGSITVPTVRIPVPAGDTTVPTDDVLIHSSNSTDLMFNGEPTTRFPCPSDLGNHDPSPGIFSSLSYDDEFDTTLNNVESFVEVSPVPTKLIHTIHPQSLIIIDPTSVVQTRSMVKQNHTSDSAFISSIFYQQRDNHIDFHHCLFTCFLSQVEPRSVAQALANPSWVDAMQEEMQQFKFQNVWVLVDFPPGKYAIGTKWILKNKRDARGIVILNKARLVAQGHRQEEGIDYDEVSAPVARIEAIRLFLAFTSNMGFLVYQMDVKSAFLYRRIEEEVYVTQPKAPRAWYATLSTFLLKHGYRRGTIDKTLFLMKNNRDIILVHVYVYDIVFGSTKKEWTATTPYEDPKPKSKSESDSPINVYLYRSMIGLLMYLTASRPDIMFAVSACSRHQVTPTTSNLEAVKKIFKHLKGQPKLGLWYLKESPLVLEAYSDNDYAGANKDRKFTTGRSEYVAAANCCGKHKHSIFHLHSTMVALQYEAEHNKVGYLLKPIGSDDYHNIIDFLRSSHIRTPYIITEDLVWSSLQLADDGGVTDLPIPKIYSMMDALGYVTEGKLTFFKNKFSPQWRFLVHTILHCLSPKSGSWDQFGSPIAIALICLSDGRRFNWSNKIFRGIVNNIGNAKKFLMYLRFLQIILGIKTRVTRQYNVLVFSSKLFANMRLNFTGNPMPLLPAMFLQEQAGEGAKVAAQDVPHPVPSPDQSPPHLTTPSRPQSLDPVAPVLEHDHSSTQPETAFGSFPSTEDAPLGGDFHTSPPRSSHTPPAGQPLGGAEDPITLTALSSVISTLVQKVHSLEAELHDHKKLFKDVVGKLVRKVKSLEVKLKTKKRKMVVSDSDEEDDTTSNVDLDALRALANAAVAVDSDCCSWCSDVTPGASSVAPGDSDVSPGVSVPPTATSVVPVATYVVPADDPTVPTVVPTDSPKVPAGASNKGKSPMIEEDIPVLARTFRQMEEDRLEVLEFSKFYTKDDWLNIRAQVEKNASLSKTLLGDDVSEDDFPARMAALIKKKRQALAEQLFKERQNRPLTLAQQKAYMRHYFTSFFSYTEKVSWPKHMHKPKSTLPTLDLDAPAQTFLKVIVDEDSDDEDYVDEVWSAVVGWEILSTPLGDINALYQIDGSTKHFATLRQILHMVDRQDLMKLYGLVGEGFFCLAKSTFGGDSELAVVHTIKYSCSGNSFWVFNSPMIHLLRVKMVLNSPWIMPILGIQELASPKANGFWYVVPTGRVIVPAGRYIVPTGSVIVATGRYIVPVDGDCRGRRLVKAGGWPKVAPEKEG